MALTLGLLGAGLGSVDAAATDQAAPDAPVSAATAPVPFSCEAKLYQSATPGPRLYVYDPVTNTYSNVGPVTPGSWNGMGYNTADDLIYGEENNRLFRLDSTGQYEVLGNLGFSGNAGDFWGPNRLLIGNSNNNSWRSVDVSDPHYPVVTNFTLTGDRYSNGAADFTVLGNTAYGLGGVTGDARYTLSVVNLSTQVVENKITTGASFGGGVGAAYADALGNIYFHANGGSVYRILGEDLDDPNPLVTSMGTAPKNSDGNTLSVANDGASCPNASSAFSSTITNESSASVSSSSASLSADVNPNGVSTTAVMCIGTSSVASGGALQGCSNTDSPTNADDTNPLTGTLSVTMNSVAVTGLTSRTTYFWQVVTSSSATTTYGSVQSFTTTGPPVTTTQPASSVTTTAATLAGVVNPGGLSTDVSFCYGTASDGSGCVSTPVQTMAAGTTDQSVSANLTGLTPGTTYYVRVEATNTDGSTNGSLRSFTTSAVPSVVIDPASGVTSTDARLNATVNPKGLSTSVSFCFGTAADFTGCTDVSASESPLVGVDSDLPITADLTALSPSTTYYVRATATNANGSVVSSDASFTTAPTPLVLTTTTGALTTGVVGEVYSRTLSAAGGASPYTWSVIGGSLPAGLNLDSNSGTVSGNPTVAGESTFTVKVTDATPQDDSKVFTMSVVSAPVVTVASATSVGSTSATVNGTVNPGNLVATAEFCVGTTPDMSGCSTVAADQSPLAKSTSASAVSTGLAGLIPGTTYYVRVQATNSAGSRASPVTSFTTLSPPTAVTGGATFRDKAGEAILNATVDANGADTTVSFCWGSTPTLVGCTSGAATPSLVTDDSGSVTVSRTVSGLSLGSTYYFNVTATNSAGTTGGSTVEFTMPTASAPTPTITAVSPNSGDATGGESITISGTNFSTAGVGVSVEIGGKPATVTNLTSTAITVTTPPGTAGTVDVIVSNNDGQAVRATNAFTYTSATYTLAYDGNGATSGSVPVDATGYTYGSNAVVAGPGSMVRNGYEFLGWNTAANGSGSAVLVGSSLPITADDTLWAQWQVVLSVSPGSLSFGARATDAGPSPAQTITVTNPGTDPVTVLLSGIAITGPGASDFTATGGTCTPSGALAGGASCTIEVVFEPSAVGARSATVSVATSVSTLTTLLTGTGTLAGPTPAPTPTPTPTPEPSPVVAAGPPLQVTATAGDARVNVAWLPPASSGSFPVTDYQMVAAPGGASCVVPVTELSCVISGLTNGVTYTVSGRALTGAGWGATSELSGPVTPTDSPDPGPAPEPVPQPDPVPGPVPPGSVKVTIDGAVDPQATGGPNPEDDAVMVVSGDYSVEAQALDSAGRSEPLGDGGQLQATAGQRVAVSGDGFHPTTYAAVYVHDSVQGPVVPDDAVIIGAILVDDSGQFTGSWALPERVTAGDHVLQIVGTTSRLEALSANVGMTVMADLTPSIRITGERGSTEATTGRVFAYARAENLDRVRVQARVKLQGQEIYLSGSRRIVRDGEFTWQRRAKKKVYVYFRTTDLAGDRVRSNRIIIPRMGQ